MRMPRILIEFPGLGEGRLFNPHTRDGVTEPFIYLRDRLRDLGFELRTADDEPVADVVQVWFWDIPATHRQRGVGRAAQRLLERFRGKRDLLGECLRGGLSDRLALFIGEPPVVRPLNWDTRAHDAFSRIMTWSDDLADGRRYHKYRFPLPARYPRLEPSPFAKRRLLVNISANKHSTHPDELYSARLATIRYFDRVHLSQFSLFGPGWDPSLLRGRRFRSYGGTVRHKWEVYHQFRFALAYENMRNAPGYVTEKIFDCLRAGTVPVYWGAPNVSAYVDPDAFIDRTTFASDAELARFLIGMSESDYDRYREAADDYLRSTHFAAFLPPAFADTVVHALQLRA